jgi:hypothetical protein
VGQSFANATTASHSDCRGLKVDLLASPKLVFVEADASEERLGLSAERYEEASSGQSCSR